MSLDDEKKKEVKTNLGFDDGFEDGVFTIPISSSNFKVKVRALFNYCREKNAEPDQLSREEIEMFIVKKDG